MRVHGFGTKSFKPLKFNMNGNEYALLIYNTQHVNDQSKPLLSICSIASNIELRHVVLASDIGPDLQCAVDTIFTGKDWNDIEEVLLQEAKKYYDLLFKIHFNRYTVESIISTKDVSNLRQSLLLSKTVSEGTPYSAIFNVSTILRIYNAAEYFKADYELTEKAISSLHKGQYVTTKTITVEDVYQKLVSTRTRLKILDKKNWLGQVYSYQPYTSENCDDIFVFVEYEYDKEVIENLVEIFDKILWVLITTQDYKTRKTVWYIRFIAAVYTILKSALRNPDSDKLTVTLIQWIPVLRDYIDRRTLMQDLFVLPLPIIIAAAYQLTFMIRNGRYPNEKKLVSHVVSHELAVQLGLNKHNTAFTRFLYDSCLDKEDMFIIRLLFHFMQQKPRQCNMVCTYDGIALHGREKFIRSLDKFIKENRHSRFTLNYCAIREATESEQELEYPFVIKSYDNLGNYPVNADVLIIRHDYFKSARFAKSGKKTLNIVDIEGPYQDYLIIRSRLIPITLKVEA